MKLMVFLGRVLLTIRYFFYFWFLLYLLTILNILNAFRYKRYIDGSYEDAN